MSCWPKKITPTFKNCVEKDFHGFVIHREMAGVELEKCPMDY